MLYDHQDNQTSGRPAVCVTFELNQLHPPPDGLTSVISLACFTEMGTRTHSSTGTELKVGFLIRTSHMIHVLQLGFNQKVSSRNV